MLRLSVKDLATIAAHLSLAAVGGAVAILGDLKWVLAIVVMQIAMLGIISRIEFAKRRADVRSQIRDARASRKVGERAVRITSAIRSELRGDDRRSSAPAAIRPTSSASPSSAVTAGSLAQDMAALRSELRGMRVAQQLLFQTVTSTRDAVAESGAAVDGVRAQVERLDRQLSGLDMDSTTDGDMFP